MTAVAYVNLSGTWHLQPGADPRTACNKEIPYGTEWGRATGDRVCRKCLPDGAPESDEQQPEPEPVEEPVETPAKPTAKAEKKA